MLNLFLTDDSLIKFMDDVDVDQENKKRILEKLPHMNEKERRDLLEVLKKLFLADEISKSPSLRI